MSDGHPTVMGEATAVGERGLLYVLDATWVTRARAASAQLQQQFALLQSDVLGAASCRRAVIICRVADARMMSVLRGPAEAMSASAVRRVEMLRGRSTGIVVILCSPADDVTGAYARAVEATQTAPAGAAVLSLSELKDRPVRQTIYAQRI